MNRPVSVSPEEIQGVLNLLNVTRAAELTPTSIAHFIGPPVTADVVRILMNKTGILTGNPQAVAELIMSAKRLGNAQLVGGPVGG